MEWRATGGTVSDDGLYTAGSATGTWAVTVTSAGLTESAVVRIVASTPEEVRVPTSIVVSPEAVNLDPADVQRFTAEIRDQHGEVMDAEIAWEATGGTIDATGLYTAGSLPGAYMVSAHSGALSATASITIEQDPLPAPPPPPSTEVEMLGAWGCSQVTHEWQAFSRNPAPFGTWDRFNYGGGALADWHDALSGQADKDYWGIFQDAAGRHSGTTDVYAEICIRATNASLFSEAEFQRMAEEVFRELRTRVAPDVRIWVTGMADWEGEVCSLAGPEGAEIAARMAGHVASLGLAERGPSLDPWTRAELESDLCHPNDQGEDRAAAEIVDFFVD
ncbi:MAG: hypothetical protein ACREMD_16270 [Gemmatimonadota bacterium]